MNEPRLIHLTSLAELRANATAWDGLWEASDVACPMARAEQVAQWVEWFAPDVPFHALVVEEAGRWVASLPLVETRQLGLVRAGMMPTNPWAPGARLLLDPCCSVERVLDRLVAGVSVLPWPVLWLDLVPLDTPPWPALPAAFARAGLPCSVRDRYPVARLDIDHDWEAFTRRWARKHRETTLRKTRRLAEVGKVRFETQTVFDVKLLEGWLRRGFEIEDRNWKGRAGSSVLGQGIFPFFLRQSEEFARRGQLHLAYLECSGRPIGFVYGVVAKGIYHGWKIGYDEEFAKYGPGNLTMYHLFQHLWQEPAYRAVDLLGEVTDAQKHWRPTTYRVGRLVVAKPLHLLGRSLVYVHEHWWSQLRRARNYLVKRRTSSARLPQAQARKDDDA
ncbi:MAG: GNAT family N-acetyltransferase [Thermoguttaceae bacterium]|jgi:CelD/BcsL family acetyltransferase involved in cellulose biosynthesis